ncbi:hypothetical protein ACH5RR_037817 [Cinchona calisaya]|uniref:myrcene synthase n=1 Tax=Cinchona calisaya TaxID=153742 RepID=A0ABD2Y798_9GENT
MQVHVHALPVLSTTNEKLAHVRRSANFHPTVWGEHFLAYASETKENITHEEQEHGLLKEEVRKMLIQTPDKSSQKLDLIDTIQRLGISYHFEREIEASLRCIYSSFHEFSDKDGNDLHVVALRFRLLRQQGHCVSCDIFNKFKDTKGTFKKSLINNVRGMLSLYEAANMGVQGESILDEALTFTTLHLEFHSCNLSKYSLAARVNEALKMPIRRTLTRLGAKKFISFYGNDELHDDVLLNFAKLDFNLLQKKHQKELGSLTEWWKSLDFQKKFPFARDRLVECYFWILAVYFEPHYALARSILTKVIILITIIDDIYDVYGTLDELILFTDAIERWHISALDELPPYMRDCYQILLDVYSEMEEHLAIEGKSDRVNYAKAEMKKLVGAYLQEAKWYHSGHIPGVEEYMKVALVTSVYMKIATTTLVLMGESVTPEALHWVANEPLIVRAASVIGRLTDDIVGHEFEQERGNVASAVECYMNEYGDSKQEAYDELKKQITNAWKDMNKECLDPISVPMPVLERVLNLARVINLLYKDGDGYTNSTTKAKEFITLVLVDPVIE